MEFTKISAIPLGPIQLQTWGLMIAVGLLLGLLVTLSEAKRKKLNKEYFIDLFIITFILGVIGSRLLFAVFHWDLFKEDLMSVFYMHIPGMDLIGAFILATLGVWVYSKLRKKLNFWQAMDTMAPGLALGLAIGRIGNYLVGDIIGSRTDFVLGSFFKGDLRHEPSLYLALNAFILFIFLWLAKPFVKKEGVMAYLLIVWYSITRFLLDFTRATDIDGIGDPHFFGLTFAQWVMLVLFLVFTPLLIMKRKKK